MSFSKKGSRKIVVDDESYRWIVRSKSTWSQQQASAFIDKTADGRVRFAVELETGIGSVMTVVSEGWHKDMFRYWDVKLDGEIASITPGLVCEAIRYGLKNGWNPHSSKPYTLDLNKPLS